MSDVPTPSRGHRFGFLIFVALLAAGIIGYVQSRPELEGNLKGVATILTVLASLILTLFWFLALSRYKARTRLIGLAVVIGLFFGLKSLTRVDGAVDGSGRPNVVWKWTPKAEVPSVPVAKATTAAQATHPDIPDVPQFFGPDRDGVVRGAHLDHDWKAHPPKELWRQPSGLGWSAFAVVSGRAFTLEQRGEDEVVACYDAPTGGVVWTHVHPKTRFTEWQGGDGPRSTPTVSNGKVYALGGTGILDCLDVATGSVVWTRNVLKDSDQTNLTWATSTSPLVFDDKVVVAGGNKLDDKGKEIPSPCVFAYQRDTGAPLWQKGADQSSYASQVLTTMAGKKVILSSNANTFSIHEAASGEVLLNHKWGVAMWPRAAQPTVIPGDRVFLSAGYGNGCVLLKIAASADGKLTATEQWHSNKMKTQFNSVHVLNGHIYGLDDGTLACLNIETGERLWKEGRFGAGQSLLVDDAIIVMGEKGDVALIEAKPDGYHEMGRIKALSSKTWNHPVLAGRYLLVRNDKEMVCFELPVQK